MGIIHFRMTSDTQAFKITFSIICFYTVLMVCLHIKMVETVLNMGSTAFTSKILFGAIFERYFFPIFNITKNIDIVLSRFFYIPCFF